MSKLLFTTILRKNTEMSNCQIDYFWKQAKLASLPNNIFQKIKPSLHLLPEIQNVYRLYGLIEGVTCKLQIKQAVIQLLEAGCQYTKMIVESISAEPQLVLFCISELLIAERIKYTYCIGQDSRLYSLGMNYQSIQQSIIDVLKKSDNGVEKNHICSEVKGVKKKAVNQNVTDLFKSGQIKMKHGKYTC